MCNKSEPWYKAINMQGYLGTWGLREQEKEMGISLTNQITEDIN